MHINSSLYNAEIIYEPWPYTVIDDFFTKDTWEKFHLVKSHLDDKSGLVQAFSELIKDLKFVMYLGAAA